MRYLVEARGVVIFSVLAAFSIGPTASWAQTPPTSPGQAWPTKTVRYVVPFGPGGSPDIVARLIADRLTRLWGQQVIVDNRVGVAAVVGRRFRDERGAHQYIRGEIAKWAKVIKDARIPQQ